jgi:hypothetical protein
MDLTISTKPHLARTVASSHYPGQLTSRQMKD